MTEGALLHPDLSQFEGTTKTRVRCTICGKSGPMEEIWVISCLAGHPAVCDVEGCDAKFTTSGQLSGHTTGKHPEKYANRDDDESKADRIKRLKQERRERLRAAGINPESVAA